MIKKAWFFMVAPTLCWASLNTSEINAYAYEGLAEICSSSRKILGSNVQEIKSLHLEKKRQRQALFPSDPNFSLYASEQLWGIGQGDHPSYEECVSLLKK